jgi:hypothetical protein
MFRYNNGGHAVNLDAAHDGVLAVARTRIKHALTAGRRAWRACSEQAAPARSYVPTQLDSLMWSEADADTRRQFADAVGHEVLDYCSPSAREAILERWRRRTPGELVDLQPHEWTELATPLEGDSLGMGEALPGPSGEDIVRTGSPGDSGKGQEAPGKDLRSPDLLKSTHLPQSRTGEAA